MELPNFKAEHLKEEDLAKLPKGPRELFLQTYKAAELVRLATSEKTPTSIRSSLEDPNFWVQKLTIDKILLPKNILELAEFWRKKSQTPTQFLYSMYQSLGCLDIYLIKNMMHLSKHIAIISQYVSSNEIVLPLQELVKQINYRIEEAYKLDRELMALFSSLRCYRQRQKGHNATFVLFGSVAKQLPDDSKINDLFKAISGSHINCSKIANQILDPVGLCKKELTRLSTAEVKVEKEFEPEKEKDEEQAEEEIVIPSIQQSEAKFFKDRLVYYLDLCSQLMEEGDLISLGDDRKFIYRKNGELRFTHYDMMVPLEAFPFIKQHKISTLDEFRATFGQQVKFCNLPGLGQQELRNNPESYVVIEGHNVSIKTTKQPTTLVKDLRCRWLSPGSRRCRAAKMEESDYFCQLHCNADGSYYQGRRCAREDGSDDENNSDDEALVDQ